MRCVQRRHWPVPKELGRRLQYLNSARLKGKTTPKSQTPGDHPRKTPSPAQVPSVAAATMSCARNFALLHSPDATLSNELRPADPRCNAPPHFAALDYHFGSRKPLASSLSGAHVNKAHRPGLVPAALAPFLDRNTVPPCRSQTARPVSWSRALVAMSYSQGIETLGAWSTSCANRCLTLHLDFFRQVERHSRHVSQ
ncbi:hypothetical protein HRbin36_01655 [bacterium HR36]|nr:hypothetical protein HRbin36_01655 [bacterium HR36]